MSSTEHIYCVIMAGGVGSRFWPMSRSSRPKQFLDVLGNGRTLIQQTFDRFLRITDASRIMVVTHRDYLDLVMEQLPEIPDTNILTEPGRKNTAPCAAYASYRIGTIDPKAIIVMAPADHLITKEDVFAKAVNSCIRKTQEEECLVTLGIKPTRPDTGYGYIQFEEGTGWKEDIRIKKVKTFTEKPDLDMARFFLKSGDFLWNSGIFIWSWKAFELAMDKHLPDMASLFREGKDHYHTEGERTFIDRLYAQCSSISIDYGIMEKAHNVYVRASVIGWSDLGTWGSLYTHLPLDDNGNAAIGGTTRFYDSQNSLVRLSEGRLALVQGLNDYIVVESDGVLLICKKEDEQKIKSYVADLKDQFGDQYI